MEEFQKIFTYIPYPKHDGLHKTYLLNQKMLLYNIFLKVDDLFYSHQLFLHMHYAGSCNIVKGPEEKKTTYY